MLSGSTGKGNVAPTSFSSETLEPDNTNLIAEHPLLPYVLLAINDVTGEVSSYLPSLEELNNLGVYVTDDVRRLMNQVTQAQFRLEDSENWVPLSVPQTGTGLNFGSGNGKGLALGPVDRGERTTEGDKHLWPLNNSGVHESGTDEDSCIFGAEQSLTSSRNEAEEDENTYPIEEEKAPVDTALAQRRSADTLLLQVLVYLEAEKRMLSSIHSAASKLRLDVATKVAKLFSLPTMKQMKRPLSVQTDSDLNSGSSIPSRVSSMQPIGLLAKPDAMTDSSSALASRPKPRLAPLLLDNFPLPMHPDAAETPRSQIPVAASPTPSSSSSYASAVSGASGSSAASRVSSNVGPTGTTSGYRVGQNDMTTQESKKSSANTTINPRTSSTLSSTGGAPLSSTAPVMWISPSPRAMDMNTHVLRNMMMGTGGTSAPSGRATPDIQSLFMSDSTQRNEVSRATPTTMSNNNNTNNTPTFDDTQDIAKVLGSLAKSPRWMTGSSLFGSSGTSSEEKSQPQRTNKISDVSPSKPAGAVPTQSETQESAPVPTPTPTPAATPMPTPAPSPPTGQSQTQASTSKGPSPSGVQGTQASTQSRPMSVRGLSFTLDPSLDGQLTPRAKPSPRSHGMHRTCR